MRTIVVKMHISIQSEKGMQKSCQDLERFLIFLMQSIEKFLSSSDEGELKEKKLKEIVLELEKLLDDIKSLFSKSRYFRL